jgi:hypothetical protein
MLPFTEAACGSDMNSVASRANRVSAGRHPIAAAVLPTGHFIYVANWGGHDISAYRIDPTSGTIRPIGGSPFASGQWPHSLAIAPSGRSLYAANGASNDVSAYRIDTVTGVLDPLAGSTSCEYFAVCGGGAPVNKLYENGTIVSSETMYCRLNVKVIADLAMEIIESSAATAPADSRGASEPASGPGGTINSSA